MDTSYCFFFFLLQEAFFGKILLDKCRDTKEKLDSDSDRDSPVFAQKAPVADVKEPCEETPAGSSSIAGNAPTSSEQSGEEMQPIVGKYLFLTLKNSKFYLINLLHIPR